MPDPSHKIVSNNNRIKTNHHWLNQQCNIETLETLLSPSSKNKKNPPRENFLYSNIKKFLLFSQKKAVLIFQETPKRFLILSQKKAFVIFWETEAPKKLFGYQQTEFSELEKGKNACSEKTLYISGNGTF